MSNTVVCYLLFNSLAFYRGWTIQSYWVYFVGVPLNEFDQTFLTFRENVVKNWVFVKENGSPYSWWKLLKGKIFSETADFNGRVIETMRIRRRDFAELLLIKVLQRSVCKDADRIESIKYILLREINLISKQETKENFNYGNLVI